MIFLISGSRREVWRFGAWVIKIPWSGPLANQANVDEANIWNSYRDTEAAPLFAEIPCYDVNGEWVIQRYCRPILYGYSAEIREVRVKLGLLGIREVEVGRHPDGRVVAIDYNLHALNDQE